MLRFCNSLELLLTPLTPQSSDDAVASAEPPPILEWTFKNSQLLSVTSQTLWSLSLSQEQRPLQTSQRASPRESSRCSCVVQDPRRLSPLMLTPHSFVFPTELVSANLCCKSCRTRNKVRDVSDHQLHSHRSNSNNGIQITHSTVSGSVSARTNHLSGRPLLSLWGIRTKPRRKRRCSSLPTITSITSPRSPPQRSCCHQQQSR